MHDLLLQLDIRLCNSSSAPVFRFATFRALQCPKGEILVVCLIFAKGKLVIAPPHHQKWPVCAEMRPLASVIKRLSVS